MASENSPAVPGLAGMAHPILSREMNFPPPDMIEPLPPERDRAVSENEDVGMVVSVFRLEGANDHPDLGIHVSEMEGLLEAFRSKRMADNKQLTFSDIRQAEDIITNYYRERGFIVSKAFVLAQEVVGGVVVIEVLEGRLGDVIVELGENSIYKKEQFSRVFEDLRGKPVIKDDLEGALLTARDFPGIDVFGVLMPGEATGETDLIVKAEPKAHWKGSTGRWDAAIGMDNYGSEYAGKHRLKFELGLNNPAGFADRLSVNLITPMDEENLYAGLDYAIPLPVSNGRSRLRLSYSLNTYEAGGEFAALEMKGRTTIARAAVEHDLARSRLFKMSASLAFNYSDSEMDIAPKSYTDDRLFSTEAMLNTEFADRLLGKRYLGINRFSLGYRRGFNDRDGDTFGEFGYHDPQSSFVADDGRPVDNRFDKIFAGYDRYQYLANGFSLLLRARGQWSNDFLTTVEQQGLGGSNNVRAYPHGAATRDKGYFGSAELIWDIPDPNNYFKVSAFADYARGWLNDYWDDHTQDNREEAASLFGVGLGVQMQINDTISGRIEAAVPVNEQGVGNEDEDGLRVLSEFRWRL